MTTNIKQLILLSGVLFTSHIGMAQTGSPSPYTSFGVGRIENTGTVKYQGMGGTGIALPSQFSVNTLNPASLSTIQREQMIIDLGIRANYTQFEDGSESGNSLAGGLNNISLAFRTGKNIATAISISQFSSVGYSILTNAYIDGTSNKIAKEFEGKGGIDELALSNSFALGDHLSLGVKLSYLFGKLSQTEYYIGEEIGGDLSVDYSDFLQQGYFQLGFQYQIPLKENSFFFGGTYSKHTAFKTSREVETSSTSGAGIYEDLDTDPYEIPTNLGGGIAWMNNRGISIALDYRFQNWDEISYNNPVSEFKDSHRFSGGLEYSRSKSRKANPYIWRLGAYYEDSYIKVKGRGIIDQGLSCGVGIPTRADKSRINVSFNYGRRGTANNTLITEKYYGLSVSMCMLETWFKKQQFK